MTYFYSRSTIIEPSLFSLISLDALLLSSPPSIYKSTELLKYFLASLIFLDGSIASGLAEGATKRTNL